MAVSKKVNHGKKRQKRSIHQLNEIKENKRARRREKALKIVLHSLYGISFLVGVALLSIAIWYQNSYNISFKDLLLSTVTPMGTVSEGFLSQMLASCVIPVAIGIPATLARLFCFGRRPLSDVSCESSARCFATLYSYRRLFTRRLRLKFPNT